MNRGGTQLPICFIPSSNSPANIIREGPELFELERKSAAFSPMHGTAHPQVAIHSPDGVSRFPGIKSDGVGSVPRDVLL